MSTRVRRVFQPAFPVVVEDVHAEIRSRVRDEMRLGAMRFVHDLFREEVEALCGPAFARKGAQYCHRGGSDPGSVVLGGQRAAVRKARVKRGGQDVELQSYAALQGFDLLQDKVLKQMMAGVSTRNYDGLLDELSGGLGLKKSSVSKVFVRGSRQALEAINGRDLAGHEWAALMIDGIEFAGTMVIAALGIDTDGKKLVLGLRCGDSENSETCKDLLQALIERGLRRDAPFLLVLDGSKALRKAVRQVFGDSFPVQRCVRHKERNALSYLPRSHHAEFRRRWRLVHGMARIGDARQELAKLVHWLSQINQDAAASVREAEGETLTVIALGATAALRKTLLSTNPLESAFGRVRSRTQRIRRWRRNTDQVERWAGASLRAAEKGFRTIRGAGDLEDFVAAVRRKHLPHESQAA